MSFVDIHISPVVLDKRTSDKCAATHFSQKHSKTTDMIFVRILLCISLLRCISLSAGVNIVTATFRVRGKHHGKDRIRKCAMKVLQNTTLIGGRISDSTGHCEEVTHSLAQKQTFESGYGHIDKIISIKAYQPEIPSGPAEYIATMFPFPLSMGSKLEFTFEWTPKYMFIFSFDECQHTCSTNGTVLFWINEYRDEFNFQVRSEKVAIGPFKWKTLCQLSKCKLTFVIHDWGIKVLENDQEITEITSVEISTLLQGMNRVSGYIGAGMKLSRLEVQR